MALVIMDAESLSILETKRELFVDQHQYAFLYTNNRVPAHGDALADYVSASYHGASGQPVRWPNPPALDGIGGAFLQGAPCIFQPSSGGLANSVYGYYVVDMYMAQLLWAERFAAGPYVIGSDTTPVTVVPMFRETSLL